MEAHRTRHRPCSCILIEGKHKLLNCEKKKKYVKLVYLSKNLSIKKFIRLKKKGHYLILVHNSQWHLHCTRKWRISQNSFFFFSFLIQWEKSVHKEKKKSFFVRIEYWMMPQCIKYQTQTIQVFKRILDLLDLFTYPTFRKCDSQVIIWSLFCS